MQRSFSLQRTASGRASGRTTGPCSQPSPGSQKPKQRCSASPSAKQPHQNGSATSRSGSSPTRNIPEESPSYTKPLTSPSPRPDRHFPDQRGRRHPQAGRRGKNRVLGAGGRCPIACSARTRPAWRMKDSGCGCGAVVWAGKDGEGVSYDLRSDPE